MNKFPGPNGQGDADRTLGNLKIAVSQVAIELVRRAFASRTAIANAAESIEGALTRVKCALKRLRPTPVGRRHGVLDDTPAHFYVAPTIRVDIVVTETFRRRTTDHFETCPFLESDASRRSHLGKATCERPVKVLGRALEAENHPHSRSMCGVTRCAVATSGVFSEADSASGKCVPTKETGPRRERG